MNTPYNYLRLSLTDRCNFNCFYCQPSLRRQFFDKSDMLGPEQILSLSEEMVSFGIRHIRLTGGEPLLRKDIYSLTETISAIPGLECLSLTTNGYFLGDFLKNSPVHLDRVNVSLDTLKKDRFKKFTGRDALNRVVSGILKAKSLGVGSVKINVVLWRHFNDDEVFDFIDFGARHNIDVRFIEYFATKSKCEGQSGSFVPTNEIKNSIEKVRGPLESIGRDSLSGPAEYYRLKGHPARIGFISSVTDNFCHECNRLRLSADGKLYLCLHSNRFIDLKNFFGKDFSESMPQSIKNFIIEKKQYNKLTCQRLFEMSSIGG